MKHLFTNPLRLNFFVALIFILAACNNSAESKKSASDSVDAKNVNTAPIKTGMAVADTISPICAAIDPVLNRAGVYNQYRWDSGQVVKVFFINGSDSLRTVVAGYASEWMAHTSVKFQFVKKLPADVTVRFVPGLDSWSVIGTNCKKANPSMSLGMDAMESESFIKSIVLHEFGHALGLIHEHQSPAADIPWNVEAVYKHYAEIGWSRATTKANVLKRYSRSIVTNSKYDSLSIMQYAINADLLTDPSFAIGWNFELSETDRNFIRTYYNTRKPNSKPKHQPDDNRGIRGETH